MHIDQEVYESFVEQLHGIKSHEELPAAIRHSVEDLFSDMVEHLPLDEVEEKRVRVFSKVKDGAASVGHSVKNVSIAAGSGVKNNVVDKPRQAVSDFRSAYRTAKKNRTTVISE